MLSRFAIPYFIIDARQEGQKIHYRIPARADHRYTGDARLRLTSAGAML